jgi:hypothetical protein
VPLSEHEQRLLEQMERALYAEDPKFATSLRTPADRRGSRRRSALAVVLALVGAGVLVGGVAWSLVPVGVVGFVIMLGGTFLLVTTLGNARRAPAPGPAGPGAAAPAAQPRRTGFMDRVEERWRRRQEGDPDA